MWSFIYFAIATIIVYLIFRAINNLVAKRTALKDTNIDTDLREFRESKAVVNIISKSHLGSHDSPVRMYERMCILDPVQYNKDPRIPGIIASYQDIISGRIIDTDGSHVPSEELLNEHNPDYDAYIANQYRAHKNNKGVSVEAFQTEHKRIARVAKEENLKTEFLATLIEKGIPGIIAASALTEGKLNSYTAEDWNKLCKVFFSYLQGYDQDIVTSFVELFDEKEIIFNQRKFEIFEVFSRHQVPQEVSVEIVRDNITVSQALRMLSLVNSSGYEWDEALSEVITEDIDNEKANELRKKYGWKN
jgi:hypothetical protein